VASSASISGLVSGLDTATIINQLMQLEAAPQTRLKSRVSTEQTQLTALQSLNTKTAALATKAAALAGTAPWSAAAATSSNSSIAVTTGTSGLAATLVPAGPGMHEYRAVRPDGASVLTATSRTIRVAGQAQRPEPPTWVVPPAQVNPTEPG
jgi:flagellar hook-associated protein 2